MERPTTTVSSEFTFEAFFDDQYPAVVRLVYGMTRCRSTAAEIAQEACIRVLQNWDDAKNPHGYVRTVAINLVRDRARRATVAARALRLLRPNEHVTNRDYLMDALRTLPVERRAMILLRFYERRTVDEIAEILDLAPGTVKSGLSRSLVALRKELADDIDY